MLGRGFRRQVFGSSATGAAEHSRGSKCDWAFLALGDGLSMFLNLGHSSKLSAKLSEALREELRAEAKEICPQLFVLNPPGLNP